MAATTLPRPSRPLYNPPTSPLPSLPVHKQRKQSTESTASASADSKRTSSSSLALSTASHNNHHHLHHNNNATPSGMRAVSSSALPTRPHTARSQSSTGSGLPTAGGSRPTVSIATPAKTLRKTISIGAFPQPPRGVGRVSSQCPPSPLSNSSSPTSTTAAGGMDQPLPQRLPTPGKKSQMPQKRVHMSKSPLGSPMISSSSVAGAAATTTTNGDTKSATSSVLLSLPSPPQSRNSSAQGSYATSATTFEDVDDEDLRGHNVAPSNSAAPTVTSSTSSTSTSKPDIDRHASTKDGKGNVLVSVRVRPDLAGGDGANTELEWMVDGRRSLISYKGKEGGEYYYDNVFATHDNNARVYDAAAKRLVRRVMEGYHGTVFAYGMTGTGKTFSMQGTATSPGVIPLAITDIFSFIRETPHREFLLRVSYLEIYNEKIHDLLSGPSTGQSGPQEEIKLREDPKRGVYATPLKEEIVQSPTQLLRVIARGDNARRVAGTQFNARSSRSHAVVQIVVESRERVPGAGTLQESKRAAIAPGGVRVSTLSLIDLAGSEKAAESKERRTEGAHINKSLLTLGTVIGRLSGDKEKSGNAPEKHLPYRDSKLTRLLQPALSGNSLVSILCTIQIGAAGSVATASSHAGETLNTLKFASRAKNNIVSHAKRAEEAHGAGGDAGSRALLDRYRIEILELRRQLEQASKVQPKEQPPQPHPHPQPLVKTKDEEEEEKEKARELEQEQRHEEQMLEMQLARTALKERIEHLNRLILSSKSLGVNSGRSFSSMSVRPQGSRVSLVSNAEYNNTTLSARSSLSHVALEVPRRRQSAGGSPARSGLSGEAAGSEEDEDSLGENGDGTASSQAQIRALRADLEDKNRYIGTLEKRLLQARRSSNSRASLSLTQRPPGEVEGSTEALLREKDAEIADLRARLDDKDRMLDALRSAARKRDVADLSTTATTAMTPTPLETSPERKKPVNHRKESSSGSTASKPKLQRQISPVQSLQRSTSKDFKSRGEDQLTKMLDEMIQEKVSGAQIPLNLTFKPARRPSLTVVNER